MIHKLTVFFVFLVVALAAGVGGTVWYLYSDEKAISEPVEGSVAGLQLGIPGGGETETQQFDAGSVVLWDTQKQALEFEQNAFERRPIASITKLMTAMVAIDHSMPWEHMGTINLDEYGPGGNLLLHPGERVTMNDLFHASLVGSANNATKAYVRELGMSEAEFVLEMNRKAVALGLEQTEFADVTGLNPHSVSTAYEVARLAEAAFTKYPAIAEAASLTEYHFTVTGSGRAHVIRNTNKLVSQAGEVTTGTKTGYLDEARWCLVMKGGGELVNRIGVILASPSESQHFADMQKLLPLTIP